MDSKGHKLDAPHNESLKNIEQLEDHSSLGGVYRNARNQFDGEILSAENREKANAEKVNAITSSIWKSSLKIGFLIPYPIVSLLLLIVGLNAIDRSTNAILLVFVIITSAAFWMITSYKAYASIFKTFYEHALRAGPFILVMLLTVLIASQAVFVFVSEYIASDSLLINLATISAIMIGYSIIATTIVLSVWGNARYKTFTKAMVSLSMIGVSVFMVALAYLL